MAPVPSLYYDSPECRLGIPRRPCGAVHCSAEVAPKLAAQIGMEILATSPAAFADFQKVEQERWTRIVEENGIKADRVSP